MTAFAVRPLGLAARLLSLQGLDAATHRGLAIAFCTSLALVMGTQIVYPALPAMMRELDLNEASIGLVITAYTLPAVFLTPFAGAIADLRGRRPLMFWGLLLFGLAGIGAGLTSSFEAILVFRAIQGIGATMLSPLSIVLLTDLVPEDREASVQGTKVVIDRIAMSGAPVLAGALAAMAWNLPFFLYALTVPVAVLGLLWLPETRPEQSTKSVRSYFGGFGEVARRPRLFVAFAAGSLRFFLDYGYFTYLPIYLALTRGTSTVVIGMLLAAFALGAIVSASQAGRITRGRDPAVVLFCGFALAGLSVLAIPLLQSDLLVAASLFVYGLGNGLISPLQKGLLTRNAPEAMRSGVVSLDRTFQQIAKSAAPAAMGALLVLTDMTAVFWVLGGLSIASVALAALILPKLPARPSLSSAP
jgi:MFS transporter, ACDE family, multidrug resistance protein